MSGPNRVGDFTPTTWEQYSPPSLPKQNSNQHPSTSGRAAALHQFGDLAAAPRPPTTSRTTRTPAAGKQRATSGPDASEPPENANHASPVAAARSHGAAADKFQDFAREVLSSIKLGSLRSEFNPKLLDVVHAAAYAPDDKYKTLSGKLSFDYALAHIRGKHKIAPAQKRTSWAAAPASLEWRQYDDKQIENVKSYGASFVGPSIGGKTYGKTLFRPAEKIDEDLKQLTDYVKAGLRNKDRMTNDEKWKLAAHFKQTFIAIHPYMDGNGRVSRLVTDRLLEEMNLPKPKWEDNSYSLDMSIADAAAQMKKDANWTG